MKTLSNIKKDLEFNKGLSSLIEVLKTIAVSQYRTLERKMKLFEKLLESLEDFFAYLDVQDCDHPFLKPREKTQIVVAVTSDSGLLGGLNMQVVTAAMAELDKIPGKLVVVGERGKVYARDYNIPFVAFAGVKDEERYEQAQQLKDYLMEKVAADGIGYLKVVYPHPVSFTVQRVETVNFLPFEAPQRRRRDPDKPLPQVIFESSIGDITAYLAYLWMGQKLYEIFGLSRLAEFAARYVHLEESSQKLKETDSKTRLEYFRVRHELIDRNMRELFSARLLFTSTH